MPLDSSVSLFSPAPAPAERVAERAGHLLRARRLASVLAPQAGAAVGRVVSVTVRLGRPRGIPVVLVRPLLVGEPYFVQPPLTVGQGGDRRLFKGTMFIGNGQTPSGTAFEVTVLVVRTSKAALRRFPEGLTLEALPGDVPASPSFTLFRT